MHHCSGDIEYFWIPFQWCWWTFVWSYNWFWGWE
jgi:hypothetical protein